MTMDRENRAHPRYELFAQVQVTRQSEVYIMSTRNISRGGVFVQGTPAEYPELQVNTVVELLVFNPADPDGSDVALRGMVVRAEDGARPGVPAGFGIQFIDMSPESLAGLNTILVSRPPSG